MSALPTRPEREAGRPLSPVEIFSISAKREIRLSRLLMLYISTGLLFMLLPGTFLGVWNLLAISRHHAAHSVSAAWIQAHGHAQIFGWIGTFILGIGFYSIPKLRRMDPFALWSVLLTWALWTSGVALRWMACVYQWHWRVLLPASGLLELIAFLIFFRTVSGHQPQNGKTELDKWIFLVIAGSIGLLLTLLINFGTCLFFALRGESPEVPQSFDQRLLVLQTWGFLVPFVWGFSAKWLPVFLGLLPLRERAWWFSLGMNSAGVALALGGWMRTAAVFLVLGIVGSIFALRLLEKTEKPAKTKGVHSSFPLFVRVAYGWAIIAAVLGTWAASTENSHGIWGASRHALTVGFLSTMVFAIGQRVLPAFAGMKLLFSTKLMFIALSLLSAGCALRVSSEVLAYQGFLVSAWSWLPVSAVIEMTAVTVFALNLGLTFTRAPRSAQP